MSSWTELILLSHNIESDVTVTELISIYTEQDLQELYFNNKEIDNE